MDGRAEYSEMCDESSRDKKHSHGMVTLSLLRHLNIIKNIYT